MFHSEGLVSRKGPLGAIWVAAYFVTKLKKAQVKDTHIPSSVDQILRKELDALTYRGLAYLLLGLVRIYSKKVEFLFHDCNTALIGVKEFVAKDKKNRDNTNVPLPPAASTGFLSIALPQCFELDAFDLGDLEDSHGDNVKPQEDITLKQDGGAGRDTESMDQYYIERFDMEAEDLGFTFHETFVADHTDIRQGTAHDMDIDAENVRDSSGEASVRVVESEPLESSKSSRDQQNVARPGEDPESNDMEREKPASVGENGDLPECIEKHRGHTDVEMTDTNMFHKEPSETPEVNKVGYSEKGFLSDMMIQEEGKWSNAKDTPVAATPKTPSLLKISEGETSHQFSIITTPGGKESSRVSRKRRCLIDDEVIIPNKFMKKMIEDSSTLVKKRKKLHHTDYPERRIKRLTDPSRSHWDPLFPYGSLDLQLLFNQPIRLKEQNTTETPNAAKTAKRMKRSSLRTVGNRGDVFPLEQTESGREIMETPQAAALSELEITVPETVSASSIAAGSAHQTKVASEKPIEPAEPTYMAPDTPLRTSEQTGNAPETPPVSDREEIVPETLVRESMSKIYSKDPETCEQETRPANSFTSIYEDRRDLDVILMDEEVDAHEIEDLQQGASLRVRIATMVNLDFSDGTSPPSDILLGRRKSPRKHPSNPSPPPPEPAAAEQVTKKKKEKKKKKTLGSSSRIWYEEDELTVLKGLVDYQAEKGFEPKSNWGDFYRFLGDSFTARFTKDQVLTKIRKLKAKFKISMQKGNTSESEAFLLSKRIWGSQNESDQSANHSKSGEEEMANDEPSNDEVTKAEFESNDESWAVRDAFETMVSRGLSDYQKKLQLEKLMNIGSGKRKELSDEWKELCAEEVKLNIKRFKFSAMLAEAAKW
ncbi:hypothetical protein Bca4012_039685 [Brassica carinata]|uniref:Uncharacterized protein n=1 Tax=Brassica carinata TaxID=52824 RepID=A0A8X8B8Q3_BRACI|nr:hypothetical protein Bca52824_007925 [Brassica carinata]